MAAQIGIHVEDGLTVLFGADTTGEGTKLMWLPQKMAFRAGMANSTSWDPDSIGMGSAALGSETKAIGSSTFAAGYQSTAKGNYSTALGWENLAAGQTSFVTGWRCVASGPGTVAMGFEAHASGQYSMAVGDLVNSQGQRSVAFGSENTATGHQSSVFGENNLAFGDNSAAFGTLTEANGFAAFSSGNGSSANGSDSFVGGTANQSNGASSVSFGAANQANGNFSSAFGLGSRADSHSSFVVGRYNVGGGTPDNWMESDPLFEVGIGSSALIKLNAMTVFKNGNVAVGAPGSGNVLLTLESERPWVFKQQGTGSATALKLTSENQSNNNKNFLIDIDPNGGVVIGPDGNAASAMLHVIGTAFKTAGGGSWATPSDRRLKKDIQPYTRGLDVVLEIDPISFYYNGKLNTSDQERQVGVVAQDLQQICPEMVFEIAGSGDHQYLQVDPSSFDFLLINAVKEQQRIIEDLIARIQELEDRTSDN
jgi:hypothetical protein